jgi:hypothetical protein
VLGLLACGTLVAGCGGSGDSRLSRGDFIKQADSICTRYEKKVSDAMAGATAGSGSQLADAIDTVLPTIKAGNDELRQLSPPEDLQKPFDRWMVIADQEVRAAARLRNAIRANDPTAQQAAFSELQRRDAQQDELARNQLGLSACAAGG